jgi:hypothetical protein
MHNFDGITYVVTPRFLLTNSLLNLGYDLIN